MKNITLGLLWVIGVILFVAVLGTIIFLVYLLGNYLNPLIGDYLSGFLTGLVAIGFVLFVLCFPIAAIGALIEWATSK